MVQPYRLPLLAAIVAASLTTGAACDDDATTAPPELAKFLVVGPEEELDLLAPPDAGVDPISPLFTFRAVFNQLLDGSKIELLDAAVPAPRSDVVTLSWTNPPGATAPVAVAALTAYDPGGILNLGPGPSLLITPAMGLPSDAELQIALAPEQITGKDGVPYVGARMLTVTTAPFTATIDVGDEPAGPTFTVKVAFSNAVAADIVAAISAVPAGATPVIPIPLTVTADPEVSTGFTVIPASGEWNYGTYTITVATSAADSFGVRLGAPVTATLAVPSPEAGAPDAAASDARDAGVDGP